MNGFLRTRCGLHGFKMVQIKLFVYLFEKYKSFGLRENEKFKEGKQEKLDNYR
jgi:hypothetical protein